MMATEIPSQELLMAEKTIQGGYNSHAMPEESYDDVSTSVNNNNPSTCSVVPGTESPFQWANLPTVSNNYTEFPMYKENTNVLLAMQPISPDYYSTEVDLKFQITFQSATIHTVPSR
jgi:hypothetical protein